ncbi:MAG: pre-peptidase C-terminal domain-containing protein [Candidatus Nealsonbacteria bacterium]|nr:pre-peptidase C-terminal domain-containing protein [Candidatus Nealsonbacteria bacterium]
MLQYLWRKVAGTIPRRTSTKLAVRDTVGPRRNRALSLETLENRQLMDVAPVVSAIQVSGLEDAEPAYVAGMISQSSGDRYENDDVASRATTIPTNGGTQTHSIHAGSDVDWVKFTLAERSEVTIETNGSLGDTRMWLYGPNSSTRQIANDDDGGNGMFSRIRRSGSNALEPGTYYVKVDEYNNNDAISSYTIRVDADAVGPSGDRYENDDVASRATTIPIDSVGNTLATARNLGVLTSNRTFSDFIGRPDTDDYYRFALNRASEFSLALSGLSADADVQVVDADGQVVVGSTRGGSDAEAINRTLDAGNYFVRVYSCGSANTRYRLRLDARPRSNPLARINAAGVDNVMQDSERILVSADAAGFALGSWGASTGAALGSIASPVAGPFSVIAGGIIGHELPAAVTGLTATAASYTAGALPRAYSEIVDFLFGH